MILQNKGGILRHNSSLKIVSTFSQKHNTTFSQKYNTIIPQKAVDKKVFVM